ncbi:HAD family phosphatase [Oscillatoria sp. FACHB-1407]|uniref:HAD family hydrolase n=1 Tax=Oscillatoria sp. FACHB-1407 TaxID=2692847 RepID=UPI001682F0BE|nr:HAD family hydrolase [Oscillatoria sp. FACHB-1407]MBD2462051.1 HAD family phosphatase [Oscillatoria sp. FACHB-1407]
MTLSLLHSSSDLLKTIRLVATDMDGTLTKQGKFTAALLTALTDLAAAGIPVVIVTGRSAGWVQGVVSYLPVAGAIAENGGLFYPNADSDPKLLVPLPDLKEHRQHLADLFQQLQTQFPNICESTDNRFRLTDWTFDVSGLSSADLETMSQFCSDRGWGFTYSTVQCHIKLMQQDKAIGLSQVLTHFFPNYSLRQVVTVGDSPNDESLFDGDRFPISVGVANVLHYGDRLRHKPKLVTQTAEVDGFCELAQWLIHHYQSSVE